MVRPARKAWATSKIRSGVGTERAARNAPASSSAPPGGAVSLRPVSPVSSARSPFCSDSANVRPMAMTSPTDFIDVVSTASASGNFSKVKRGILVTT